MADLRAQLAEAHSIRDEARAAGDLRTSLLAVDRITRIAELELKGAGEIAS